MRIIIPSLAGLLFAALCAAQQDPAPDSKPAPQARLLALQQEQKQIVADWQKTAEDARKAAEAAKKDGKPIPAMPMRPDMTPLIGKVKAAAADYAGTEDAVPFLVWLVQIAPGSDKEAFRAALSTLADKHKDSSLLRPIGRNLGMLLSSGDRFGIDKPAALDLLGKLLQSADADVRGWAQFAKHQATIESAAMDGEDYKSARALLLAAAKGAESKDLTGEIEGAIDLRERLGVGNTAPEIEGEDLDGVEFKLSDYKGKVVFLDFWGDW